MPITEPNTVLREVEREDEAERSYGIYVIDASSVRQACKQTRGLVNFLYVTTKKS
jgi:hypothetical protein